MNEDDRDAIAQALALRQKLANCNPEDIEAKLLLLLALLEIYEEILKQ